MHNIIEAAHVDRWPFSACLRGQVARAQSARRSNATFCGALPDSAEALAKARRLGPDEVVKPLRVTWGVLVTPGSLLAGGSTPPPSTGDAKPGDARKSVGLARTDSSPTVDTHRVLKVLGVGALAASGVAGLVYLLSRTERRDRQALEQDLHERTTALEQQAHGRQQLERFIEDTVEAAAMRHFGELRGRVEAGERGRDLRARSREQERDNRATEAERRREGKAGERDKRAAAAERERDRKAAEAAAQRDRKATANEASRAGSAASAWAQQQRELQQRADAQLAAYKAEMQGLKDQLTAQLRPPAPAPSPGSVPGGITERLRKLYDDD
jgi:hypothetical protein